MGLNAGDWFKDAIFYEVYIRAYQDSTGDGNGDIKGLISKIDHIRDLGVDCLWILPHYPSPLKDDGYDISDHYGIHPDYGTLEDFKDLVRTVHEKGLKIIVDLVLNHTSDEHEWFRQARKSKASPYREYYVWSDSPDVYQDARIIFLDTEGSNWAWEEESQQYYWHRFYSSQPDLNYDHPTVQEEMLRVVQFWLDLGVDGFRADAVPYLFEREGTNCENLVETHDFLKTLRKYMDDHFPGRLILSEANQWPEDVRAYFGDGDEVHMNFHFPLMPRIFMALESGDVTPVKNILARTPEIPENCQWCTFLRNHDELTLEMVTEEERQWMWEVYAPEKRMRLNLGIRRRLAPLLGFDVRKILLANSLLLTLPGSPVIYYGDEIGMGDNIWLKDRDGVRTPMQWNSEAQAGFSTASADRLYAPVIDHEQHGYKLVNVQRQVEDPDSLLSRLKLMLAERKKYPAFGRGAFRWADGLDHPSLACYWRETDESKLLVLQNLSDQIQSVDLTGFVAGEINPLSILTGERISDLHFKLLPYEFSWLEI